MLVHVLLAFHFVHQWSHAAAVADTARQTEALLGQAYGQGVWWNYVFTASWLLDALLFVARPESYRSRAKAWGIGLMIFWVFMVFSATVVFEAGVTRWGAVLCFGILAVAAWRRRR